jgi:hypothetical protein
MEETDYDTMSLSDLEDRLTTQAAVVAAETAEFLAMLVAFDRRCGWRGDGVRSCIHWMNWQLGTSVRTAREQLRVAHALPDLPLIGGAFSRGEISYSRVRAITRIAVPQTEEHLLTLAKESTGAQLERIVRTYRLLDQQNDVDPPPPPGPELHRRPQPDGRVTITLTVDPVDAEVVWNAVHHAMTPDAERPIAERRADALVVVAEGYLAGQPADRSGSDRTRVVVHADARRVFLGDGTRLDARTAERVTCETGRERTGSGVSAGLRRQLMRRDGGCIWPGCDSRHHLHAHHVVHREHGGRTRLDNLVLLCGHHHRVLHSDGYRIVASVDRAWVVLRPDGSPIERVPRPKAVPRNRFPIAEPTPATITGSWQGDRLDVRELLPIPVLRS